MFFSILTSTNYYRPDSSAENLIEPTHPFGTILVGPGFPALRKSVKPNLVMFILAPLPFRTLFVVHPQAVYTCLLLLPPEL